jgi:hypothetical protein
VWPGEQIVLLKHVRPGTAADEEADAFYGYYTLHVLTDGKMTGVLSVNGYTGQVWYHTWHGAFVDMAGHFGQRVGWRCAVGL